MWVGVGEGDGVRVRVMSSIRKTGVGGGEASPGLHCGHTVLGEIHLTTSGIDAFVEDHNLPEAYPPSKR